ncbi:hypothetical protein CDFC105_72945 [Clostridioides difficile]|nr:hypothetical protein CDFC105_64166 [Clostridioides difficile]CZS08894.1 hypothetical protein CDFC105_72945 [Clostridioides difficile]
MDILDTFQMKEDVSLIVKAWGLFKSDLLKLIESSEEENISTEEMIKIIKLIKDRLKLTDKEIKVIDRWTICLIEGCKKYDAEIVKIMDMTVKKLEKNFCNN